ncbi:MAG TPA: prepilin-type N-terminal cleavage/methylation domain-containing protein [Sumerlaeia bacterium]|nr:prepilin-type N-terminal cleavage/methylation domain-containing protein [Sumerlaeia bacterium]
MRNRKAFTLIELLIVVAIIAILAAIAVPNFLEAQTRSKVSACKADMRAMQLAQEAYRVDNEVYVPDNFPGQQTDVDSFKFLSSPIAYITSVPTSPFNERVNVLGPNRYFEYWRGHYEGNVLVLDEGSRETGILYRITSVGPDDARDYGGDPYRPRSDPASNWPYYIHNNDPLYLNGLYDATNGTKSRGDLMISPRGIHNN